MSHVKCKKCQCYLNGHVPCHLQDALVSPVVFKKYPMSRPLNIFSCHKAPCHMSILRNAHVTVSNLGVEGHGKGAK